MLKGETDDKSRELLKAVEEELANLCTEENFLKINEELSGMKVV